MDLSTEQCLNFWQYSCLNEPFEFSLLTAIVKIYKLSDDLTDKSNAENAAAHLGEVINMNNPLSYGEKCHWIMSMAKAYSHYLEEYHHNHRFSDFNGFYRLCQIISKHVI